MRILRALFAVAIALVALASAAAGIFRGAGGPGTPQGGGRRRLAVKAALAAVAAGLLLAGAGGVAFMYSGFYDIAADEPHAAAVRWALTTGRDRSVRFHTRGIAAPDFHDPALVRQGLIRYRENCQPCHGAPGAGRDQLGRGINPSPPPLMTAAARWTDAQLYWILTHGLKLSGMPAFGVRLNEADRWALVAFTRRMAWMSPSDYRRFVAALDTGTPDDRLDWVLEDDQGLSRLETEGDPAAGRALLASLGCVSCHAVPGREQAAVGPPLTAFAGRQFIAGVLVNTPRNLERWILDPQRFEPRTAMPNVGATPGQALHIAAYLYTLGDRSRLRALREKPPTRNIPRASRPNGSAD